ncbi:Protein of unknown function [Gryllus bimaculatus]|nr:Protein of unknown function [Gryllus bimaculatus]
MRPLSPPRAGFGARRGPAAAHWRSAAPPSPTSQAAAAPLPPLRNRVLRLACSAERWVVETGRSSGPPPSFAIHFAQKIVTLLRDATFYLALLPSCRIELYTRLA